MRPDINSEINSICFMAICGSSAICNVNTCNKLIVLEISQLSQVLAIGW